jgi:hypothetical protein
MRGVSRIERPNPSYLNVYDEDDNVAFSIFYRTGCEIDVDGIFRSKKSTLTIDNNYIEMNGEKATNIRWEDVSIVAKEGKWFISSPSAPSE